MKVKESVSSGNPQKCPTKFNVKVIPTINKERQLRLMFRLDALWMSNYFVCPRLNSDRKYHESKQPKKLKSNWLVSPVSIKSLDFSYQLKESEKVMINILPEREQWIIEMSYDYGYTEMEIANMLNISQQRVHQIKRQAIRRLKEC